MLLKLVVVFFFSALDITAWATTRASSVSNSRISTCEISGIFTGEDVRIVRFRQGAKNAQAKQIYWNIDLRQRSSSDPLICPQEPKASVRVRGAGARGREGAWSVDYPVHINQPIKNTNTTLQIRHISGLNSYTREAYAEWTFHESVEE
jgi:hypothetical protein